VRRRGRVEFPLGLYSRLSCAELTGTRNEYSQLSLALSASPVSVTVDVNGEGEAEVATRVTHTVIRLLGAMPLKLQLIIS